MFDSLPGKNGLEGAKIVPGKRFAPVQELKGGKALAEYTLDNETDVTLRNSGAITLKVTPLGVSDFIDDFPSQFTLSSSYPNPVNPSTNIQYELPQQVAVSLEVYNMIGRKGEYLVGESAARGRCSYRLFLMLRRYQAVCILSA